MGFTYVVWGLRKAVQLSPPIHTGLGPESVALAAQRWGELGMALGDAAAHITNAVGQLEAGWRGSASDKSRASLTSAAQWLTATAPKAAHVSAVASIAATAYSVARLTMPTPIEIAAVQAMKVAGAASAATGGIAAAEAAERMLDLRAVSTMTTYEQACSGCAVPTEIQPPRSMTTHGEAHQSDDQSAQTTLSSAREATFTGGSTTMSPTSGSSPQVTAAGVTTPASIPSTPAFAGTAGAPGVSPVGLSGAGAVAPIVSTAVGRIATMGADAARSLMGSLPGHSAGSSSAPSGGSHARAGSTSLPTNRGPLTAPALLGPASGLAGGPSAVGDRGVAGSQMSPIASDNSRSGARQLSGGERMASMSEARTSMGPMGAPMLGNRPGDDDEQSAGSKKRQDQPQKQFDTGPAGQLVCPPIIGASTR
ncbi:PPE domain-containing protein [Hoyosella rhizosphaerae]|uniref:PPE domain-containing protein n=1 Tax=Hoyosella rhizosphaerae TaxID=1755582 RepID=UPI001669CD28|nr:PPE domain-containing protein [Hoyosella rhizosphaerae]MBN4927407.1 PPE domain-containing protein [Hoyosella rhizosphaerae]